MTSTNSITAYASYFKRWSTKKYGPKPTAKQISEIHALGFQAGSFVALANAMYNRPAGATTNEVIGATQAKTAQLNRREALITAGRVDDVSMPPRDGHRVYKIKLKGPKGQPQAVKAKGKAKDTTKAVKAKAKPAAPTSDAPSATGDTT